MLAGPSKSQIEKLGLRLVGQDGPTPDDLGMLHDLLLDRSRQLDRAELRVREALGVVPTSRVKNTETIFEKLRRRDGSGLKSVQDLAGRRIVGDFDRLGQDELVERVVVLFGGGERHPKVVDRRTEPMHGYRAVHVIVFPEGDPIEIQLRTQWQHEWAEFFEKLADRIGRGIRYGEPPTRWWEPVDVRWDRKRELFEVGYALREKLVDLALAVADLIAAVEEAEGDAPDDPRLHGYKEDVNEALASLQDRLRHVRDLESMSDSRSG
ncbi:MAG: hypothetical protein GXY03_09135 [Solirubrobacterales bacterium]|nr:hypothetical protein [Solirubrobacterales bacterium]